MMATDKQHPFEMAGLSLAPFQFVGMSREVGPHGKDIKVVSGGTMSGMVVRGFHCRVVADLAWFVPMNWVERTIRDLMLAGF